MLDFGTIYSLDSLLALLILTFLEIILGIDNVIFLAIVTNRLDSHLRQRARLIGLSFALIMRLVFLAGLFWLVKLSQPLCTIFDFSISIRDLLMVFGGIFLIYKSTQEIHLEMQPKDLEELKLAKTSTLTVVIAQIIFLDSVFSFDSLFTAIGISTNFFIIAIAICIAIIMMMFASKGLSEFVQKNPSIKMLALSFLMLIGTVLVADGFHYEIPKGYIYFSVCFSLFVEILNSFHRKRKKQHKKLRLVGGSS